MRALLFILLMLPVSVTYGQKDSSLFTVNLHAPWMNHFALDPDFETRKNGGGFQGAGIGAELKLGERAFVRLELGAAANARTPVGVVDYEGEFEVFSSGYATMSHGFRTEKFALAYGLSMARNSWSYRCSRDSVLCENPTRPLVSRSNTSFGLNFIAEYQIGRSFYTGLHYRPTFLRVSDRNAQAYEHLASLVFGWRVFKWPRIPKA